MLSLSVGLTFALLTYFRMCHRMLHKLLSLSLASALCERLLLALSPAVWTELRVGRLSLCGHGFLVRIACGCSDLGHLAG